MDVLWRKSIVVYCTVVTNICGADMYSKVHYQLLYRVLYNLELTSHLPADL